MDDKEPEIQEAEVDELGIDSGRNGINYNLIFLCVVSLLLGLAIKTEFAKRYTIGFDDGLVKTNANSINLGQLEKEVADRQSQAQEEAAKQQQQQLEEQGDEAAIQAGDVVE